MGQTGPVTGGDHSWTRVRFARMGWEEATAIPCGVAQYVPEHWAPAGGDLPLHGRCGSRQPHAAAVLCPRAPSSFSHTPPSTVTMLGTSCGEGADIWRFGGKSLWAEGRASES